MLVTVRKSSYVKYYCFFFLCIFSSHCCLFYMFIGRWKVQSSSAVCDLTARSLLNLLAGLQAEVVGGFLSNCTFGIIFNFWPQFFFFPLLTFFLLGSIFFFFFLSNAAVNFFMLIIQLFMPLSLVVPSIWKMNGISTEGVKSSPKISCKNNSSWGGGVGAGQGESVANFMAINLEAVGLTDVQPVRLKKAPGLHIHGLKVRKGKRFETWLDVPRWSAFILLYQLLCWWNSSSGRVSLVSPLSISTARFLKQLNQRNQWSDWAAL